MNLLIEVFDSPCGQISIVFDEVETLYHLDFPDQGDRQVRMLHKRFKDLKLMKGQSKMIRGHILSYMSGKFDQVEQIRCSMGGTDFQNRVWQALRAIPVGKTCSYSDIAVQIGHEKAVRAVARANALNPVSILYPCHRVIARDGSLRGYAGGVGRKNWLLRHEGAI
ncbi:MAG: methylated-DNA--[protein]-cysteine S-methyltransferase [Methylocystaceae bacterium]|nr:methylated-DNA--[protein]-cysteine S-methyltransferase [Methylocystaceae bacterium]